MFEDRCLVFGDVATGRDQLLVVVGHEGHQQANEVALDLCGQVFGWMGRIFVTTGTGCCFWLKEKGVF